MSIAAEPRSRMHIRKITEELREVIGCENELKFPVVEFIEWILANPDNGIDLEILEPEEMQDIYGITNTGENRMCIRSDVYEGAIAGNVRDRFTLCHEVGHYFLHQPDSVYFPRSEAIPKYCDPEWQANTFAGELMAPYQLIKDMTVEEIMDQCGMSKQAANIQYKQCHK